MRLHQKLTRSKFPHYFLIIATITLIATSSLLAHKALSHAQAIHNTSSADTVITLILPDQEYSLSSQELSSLESELVIPPINSTPPDVLYYPKTGLIELVDHPMDYFIDIPTLRTELEKYSGHQVIKHTPTFTLRDQYRHQLSTYNQQLQNIIRTPLVVRVKDGRGFSGITLNTSFIRQILTPTSFALNIPPTLNKVALIDYLTSRLTSKQKRFFDSESAFVNTQVAINQRFIGGISNTIILGVDDGPESRGELADKYLEIDLSQQKMYFFINNQLFNEYHVSTGKDYPTPVGEYHILNKAPKAFSDIYNVWMPYWMGFSYANDVGVYLGLHEIAYAVNEFGNPFYRYGYYIGDPMTGGCVAMEPKNSQEIYNLSDIGMLVRVIK